MQLSVFNVNILSPRRKYVKNGNTKYEIPKLMKRADHREPPIALVVNFQAYQKDKPHGMPNRSVAITGLFSHQVHIY